MAFPSINLSTAFFADSGASYCTTPDEFDFIPGTYKDLTGVTINGIAERLKVTGCGSVSWIYQDYKKENIEIIIEQVLRIPVFPIWIIFPQQVAKQAVNIGDGLNTEKDKAHLILGGLKFTA